MNPKTLFDTEVLKHPIVAWSLGAVALIAVGSVAYYVISTRSPRAAYATAAVGSITETVIGSGTVAPAQNPDLAFESGGRVVSVSAKVGDHVAAGHVLASLDVASLRAQQAGAIANVQAAQAKLDELQSGPRDTDVASGQTAVAQAQQSLTNLYANVPATLTDAYNKAYNGVRQNTDALFTSPTTLQPTLAFQTTDSQAALNASSARTTLNTQLQGWQTRVSSMGSDEASIDSTLTYSLGELMAVRTYTSTLLEALANAVPSGTFDAAAIASAQTSVGTLNTTISSLIISLQNAQQQIASAKLAVQSAQDALAKINAGSTSQTIEAQQAAVNAAQAQVENLAAQINDALIIAPFSGTVASVNVKTGQTVSADAVAMSLTPQSALQVELQVSELDIAKLTVGDSASVTLDAYGSSHIFPATVVSIDRAPTVINGVSSYKVVLQFADDDSSIATGMTANATIVAAQKQNVLTIQKSAVLHSGADTFVLVPSSSGPIQQKIQTGVESDTQVEVTSGLSAGSEYLVNAQ